MHTTETPVFAGQRLTPRVPIWLRYAVIALIVAGIFFRFINLSQKVYWTDEALTSLRSSGHTKVEFVDEQFTGAVISPEAVMRYQSLEPENGWGHTLAALMGNAEHTPLYFLGVRGWMELFGSGTGAVRGLSGGVWGAGVSLRVLAGARAVSITSGGVGQFGAICHHAAAYFVCSGGAALQPVDAVHCNVERGAAAGDAGSQWAKLGDLRVERGAGVLHAAFVCAGGDRPFSLRRRHGASSGKAAADGQRPRLCAIGWGGAAGAVAVGGAAGASDRSHPQHDCLAQGSCLPRPPDQPLVFGAEPFFRRHRSSRGKLALGAAGGVGAGGVVSPDIAALLAADAAAGGGAVFGAGVAGCAAGRALVRSNSWQNWLWRGVLGVILAIALSNNLDSANSDLWWNKSISRSAYYAPVAEMINREAKPLVITDRHPIPILAFNRHLDAHVRLQLVGDRRNFEVSKGYKPVFLLNPLEKLRDILQSQGYRLTVAYRDPHAPGVEGDRLWRVQRPAKAQSLQQEPSSAPVDLPRDAEILSEEG